MLQLKSRRKYLEKNLPGLRDMAHAVPAFGDAASLKDAVARALRSTAPSSPSRCPATQAEFAQPRARKAAARLTCIAQEMPRLAAAILAEYQRSCRRSCQARRAFLAARGRDMTQQCARLLPTGLPRAHAVGAAAAFPALPQGGGAAAGQAARRPGARRAAACAELAPLCRLLAARRHLRQSEAGRAPIRSSSSSAGCWRSCACRSSRRN